MQIKSYSPIFLSALLLTAVGCDKVLESQLTPASSPPSAAVEAYVPTADAGAKFTYDPSDTTTVSSVAQSRKVGIRGNPFRLTASESSFQLGQTALRFADENGSFSNEYVITPPEDPNDDLVRGPIPQWRLSGIIVSERGVAALLEKDGEVVDIYPGADIPNSDWEVVSIDEEKAVLRRKSNTVPKEIEIRLGSGPFTSGAATQGPGIGGGGGSRGSVGGPGGLQAPGGSFGAARGGRF